MKPVFKCDYCQFMGTEEEVREHELNCMDNYDRRSCYTCKHKMITCSHKIENNEITWMYKCSKDVDVPEGKIYEFCNSYERKLKPESPLFDTVRSFFGGNF